MRKIASGIKRFQQNVYPRYRQMFEGLALGQSPETLLITCSDSRVVPEMITQSQPGELFVYRNAGNMVPAYRTGDGSATFATIEYAVAVLRVNNLIVCGHSDCGAMRGVLHPEKVAALPGVDKWLRQADCARRIVCEHHSHLTDEEKLPVLTRQNVLAQLESVKTHPSVALAMSRGELELHGLYYDISSGSVSAYHPDEGEFSAVRDTLPSAIPAMPFGYAGKAA